MNSIASANRRQSKRLYGFRLYVVRPGQLPRVLSTIWGTDIPHEWEDIQADPSVTRARLFQSGKLVATYQNEA